MIEVKKVGIYDTKCGRKVEIYGFDEENKAEGFFIDNRHMAHWEPETGKKLYWKDETGDDLDIVSFVGEVE